MNKNKLWFASVGRWSLIRSDRAEIEGKRVPAEPHSLGVGSALPLRGAQTRICSPPLRASEEYYFDIDGITAAPALWTAPPSPCAADGSSLAVCLHRRVARWQDLVWSVRWRATYCTHTKLVN